jgi:glycosyltransferase involved in cell wall biosynthesis
LEVNNYFILNILIITPRIPFPPYRGDKLKIFNIAKILSKKNKVTILTFKRSFRQEAEIEELKALGFNIITIRLTLIESLFRAFWAIFSNTPFQVAWYQSSKMKKKVLQISSENDVVYYHLVRSAQYLKDRNDKKLLNVLDFTDAVSLYLTRMAIAERNFFRRFFIKIEKRRISEYEGIAEKFNTLYVCSNVDKKFLSDSGIKVNIELLNNGIDTEYFSYEDNQYEINRVIFTGNMPYYPNQDAAAYFAKEILPLISKEIPETKFYIVGQKPPLKIKKLESDKIKVTGFVSDIRKEYLKSTVNVAPMRFGAGTLNKVIEAIALGVPTVASSIAAQGLPEQLKKYILIADDPVTFADYVKEIMNNSKKYRTEMLKGQNTIRELLSWEKVVNEFEKSLLMKLAVIHK